MTTTLATTKSTTQQTKLKLNNKNKVNFRPVSSATQLNNKNIYRARYYLNRTRCLNTSRSIEITEFYKVFTIL